ncbi:hypothetical protein QE250_02715 [Chromatiaceae bacterium AAb-1]|nr:hypothetical protein [Chromatiaceae bacterium AAb-1]
MTKLDKEQVIADFTAAYKAAFGKEPQLEQKPGWFSVDGGKNIRLAELEDLGKSYGAAKAAKPVKAAPAPAAAPKKAPTARTPSAKSGNGGETAYALWASRQETPKQRLPRGSR